MFGKISVKHDYFNHKNSFEENPKSKMGEMDYEEIKEEIEEEDQQIIN